MKTYQTVFSYCAKQAFAAFMNGADNYLEVVDYRLIAFIYDIPVEVVKAEIKKVLEKIMV